ncbi:MAG: hypothetical protein HY543_09300 [Deltaproteobacteria bacterium]|nr:hypothetical protein [Deltaproteobacteria bacterium]
MKTTIDIVDSLFKQIKAVANAQGLTMKAIIEGALRRFLETEKTRPARFRLRKHPFRGRGMAEGISEGDWQAIRTRIYERQGG